MKAKWFITVLIVGLLIMSVVPVAGAAPKPIDYRPVDVGPEIRGWDATQERISNTPAEAAAEAAAVTSSTPLTGCTLDTKIWMRLNSVTGSYGFTTYILVAEGPLAQIWVQTNLAWPAGDPRPTPEITCEQAQYMLGEFENNMYPTETSFFGMPDTHDGSNDLLTDPLFWDPDPVPPFFTDPDYYFDSAGRQVVLVSNVRDENYFDPSYPIYIAGFFSPSYEAYFDRNVMTIDAYDWANRTGPSGTRPYLYEGVFAHEYQHLLHADYDPAEENFINEGMSDLAMVLTGYGQAVIGHQDAAADFPENSLTIWGDQGDLEILTDYGQAFLFQYYLMEQFGPPFIQALFHNQDIGTVGVDSTLAAFGSDRDFSEVFHDWSIAMLIDSKKPEAGRYQFNDFDFKLNIGTPSAPNPEAFDTPGAPPWGTDYLWITGNPKDLRRITFNGLPYSTFPTAWSSDGSVLWSGTGDLVDNWAIFPAVGGGALTFDTTYDFEQYWDFGFVQVSTDGGYNWTSLANASTTDLHDPNAHPTVIANLPGLTGTQSSWVNLSYDLSAYAGQDILIGFRYVTDWATYGNGWLIDNVVANGTLISDGTSVTPFKDITEILPINNDFTVTFVGTKGSGRKLEYKIKVMHLNHITETGMLELQSLLKSSNSVVMLVSYNAAVGVSYYADYTYTLDYRHSKPRHQNPVHGHGDGSHYDHHGNGHHH
jgi:immune inhibitor A